MYRLYLIKYIHLIYIQRLNIYSKFGFASLKATTYSSAVGPVTEVKTDIFVTSFGPVSDVEMVCKPFWLLKHCLRLLHWLSYTWMYVSPIKKSLPLCVHSKEYTQFSQLCAYSFKSCLYQPSLFQHLGRMSLVQLRILIWLTIPPSEMEWERCGWC